jgi:membrane-associated protease RseP (regulator of RpoE activity)
MIDLYLLSVILFFSLLAVLIYRDRKKIDFKYYILFMRRTKRFRDILDRIARKSILFWKIVGTIAIVVCLYFMAQGTYALISTAYLVYTGVITQPALQIALPIPSSQMTVGPGFIGIPFWFWIIVIAVILIPHETFHGIIARAEKIKLKDVGLLLLAIFPGAFVEPDEKQLEKSKTMTKLRIFAAGSFINILIGISVMFLVQYLIWAPNTNGILITSVNETSPAGLLGLKPGMVLESVDGKGTNVNFNDYSFLFLMVPKSNTENITYVMSSLVLSKILESYKPGDVVTLNVSGSNYTLKLGENPQIKDFPYIGIGSMMNVRDISLFLVVFPILGMIASLSFLVGIFNILPIYPLDGGLIVKTIAERFFKKKTANKITMAITIFLVIIIIYSFVGGFFH